MLHVLPPGLQYVGSFGRVLPVTVASCFSDPHGKCAVDEPLLHCLDALEVVGLPALARRRQSVAPAVDPNLISPGPPHVMNYLVRAAAVSVCLAPMVATAVHGCRLAIAGMPAGSCPRLSVGSLWPGPWAPWWRSVVAERRGVGSVGASRRRVGRSIAGVSLSRTPLAVARARGRGARGGVGARRGWT